VGTLTLRGGEVLSVSGDYERFVTVDGRPYHHILDPATGYPADTGLSSVAVIARDGALADALSTALFVMGAEAAIALYHSGVYAFEAVLVGSDGALTLTDGAAAVFEQ
jgi:thiamine biosynthesis lipoprotein